MTSAQYQVQAFNYAFDSENKIHSDDVASRYGFKGGLVPGVADFAYMLRAAHSRFGDAWSSSGRMQAKFFKPIYHGELASATATPSGPDHVQLELMNADGVLCAAGEADRHTSAAAPSPGDFDELPLPDTDARPEPAVDTFPAGLKLGAHSYRFDAAAEEDKAASMFVDAWPRGPSGAVSWHPALALHDANLCLRQNVALGPWIHTGSDLQLYGAPTDGSLVSIRGTVAQTFVKRGHTMTILDLAMFSDDAPVARIQHSAIIRLANG